MDDNLHEHELGREVVEIVWVEISKLESQIENGDGVYTVSSWTRKENFIRLFGIWGALGAILDSGAWDLDNPRLKELWERYDRLYEKIRPELGLPTLPPSTWTIGVGKAMPPLAPSGIYFFREGSFLWESSTMISCENLGSIRSSLPLGEFHLVLGRLFQSAR
jgi:hypothetical protein